MLLNQELVGVASVRASFCGFARFLKMILSLASHILASDGEGIFVLTMLESTGNIS
jgi:hypothetical protein